LNVKTKVKKRGWAWGCTGSRGKKEDGKGGKRFQLLGGRGEGKGGECGATGLRSERTQGAKSGGGSKEL